MCTKMFIAHSFVHNSRFGGPCSAFIQWFQFHASLCNLHVTKKNIVFFVICVLAYAQLSLKKVCLFRIIFGVCAQYDVIMVIRKTVMGINKTTNT